jgi:hypothetical protein
MSSSRVMLSECLLHDLRLACSKHAVTCSHYKATFISDITAAMANHAAYEAALLTGEEGVEYQTHQEQLTDFKSRYGI